ncbi:semaphorin-4G-like [Megalops cyprinoides]|uniref:semaphorin-4G-like n=1 Tax=Megalops cyprinoides TaxID=118141 RepID=UPI001863F4FA|nr:semaphorin-4G-like [Megalops cyprinoides]
MDTLAALLRLLLFCSAVGALLGYSFQFPQDLDATPRTSVGFHDLLGYRRFSGSALNYSTLLLEEDAGVIYVGARGALFSLDSSDVAVGNALSIEWDAPAQLKQECLIKGKDNQTECFNHIRFLQRFNATHLYICGTHAFSPLCAYVDVALFKISSEFEDGREKCPYDPATGYTGLLVDGEMYTASQFEFRSLPDIRRNFPSPMLKTEGAPTRWLLEADFVGSALVRQSAHSSIRDDDKIYFFFTEKSQEQTLYFPQNRVARVARVCKGDVGGQRTLQKKWTSFLKARLVCSFPDYRFHFNVLRSIFILEGPAPQSSILYGVFGLEWKNVKASAICQYSFADVQRAFDGPYMESQDSTLIWREYTSTVPEPRPGSCITDKLRATGINSSRDLPDDVLEFIRRHPLMFQPIHPQEGRPLLFKRNMDYTKMAVRRVTALDGRTYHVLFMGTDEGWLHRAVEVKGHIHIIEELQLFEKPQPVDSIVISEAMRSVYVGAPTGVVQVPLSTCHRYASCFDCIFARDPSCAWDGKMCVEMDSLSDRYNLTQDILNGNSGCENRTAEDSVPTRTRSVTEGDDVLLLCEIYSNLATPRWTLNGCEPPDYSVESGYRMGTDGLLIVGARVEQGGEYRCFAVENGIQVPVVNYMVRVLSGPPPIDPTTAAPSSPHRLSSTPPGTPMTSALPPPPVPLPSGPRIQISKTLEVMYLSLIVILAGLCIVLTSGLLYMVFCMPGRRGKYSLQGSESERNMELRTISSNCNGGQDSDANGGLLQIVPGEGQASPNKEPLPPAPPLPPPLPTSEYTNGVSATLPSVLRKMNGNSYVLLRQNDPETTSPLYHSFTEELNKILEKRKHTQLVSKPDESSV